MEEAAFWFSGGSVFFRFVREGVVRGLRRRQDKLNGKAVSFSMSTFFLRLFCRTVWSGHMSHTKNCNRRTTSSEKPCARALYRISVLRPLLVVDCFASHTGTIACHLFLNFH